jgi:hypothetical protein
MKLNKLEKFAELLPEYITESRVEKGRPMGPAEYVRWQFPNKYGASLACHNMTNGKPEFAVTYNGDICYDSGVTNDVIGYTTVSEVALYLAELRGL